MRLEQLIAYFQTSPALRLLRSPNAPFVLDFLYKQYKGPGRISLTATDLSAALAEHLELIHELHPEVLKERPEQYLSAWSTGDTRWLHRFLEGARSEPLYQLTPHTEEVFVFLDRAIQSDLSFVGTESRLKLVVSTLADLVAGASKDPDVRLAHLRRERQRIDDEMSRIARDGAVAARYEPAAIRERFATAVRLLKDLLADFRAVEARFKNITQQVQRRQLEGKDSRGSILEFALDAEDILKKDDQGVSFYEFFRFILSPDQHERIQQLIAELGRVEELSAQADGLATVRRMVPSLIADAVKVMRTNQRLSATLRRLLDSRAAADRRHIAHLLSEIRALAATMSDDPPVDLPGATVETGASLSSPFSRTFWAPPREFAPMDLVEQITDDERRLSLFQTLAQLHRLDWPAMRRRVRDITKERAGRVTLSELVEEYPPAAGAVEILGYIQIAKDDRHDIDKDRTEVVVLRRDGHPPRWLTVPLVHFLPLSEESHAAV